MTMNTRKRGLGEERRCDEHRKLQSPEIECEHLFLIFSFLVQLFNSSCCCILGVPCDKPKLHVMKPFMQQYFQDGLSRFLLLKTKTSD